MPNFRPHSFAVVVDVDADDLVRADHPRALQHVEADAAETEDDDIVARLRPSPC